MSEQFTEVSEQGLGSNLLDSIKGVAVGGLLFILSFPVLWWNEGRTDLSQVAKKAQVVKVDAVDKAGEGKLVSVTGELRSDEKVSDPDFLQPGPYVRLQRVAEMYAWVENKDTKTKKNLGGSKTTETTYSYETEWTARPKSTSGFKVPEGHENPSMPIEGQSFSAKKATIGAYEFDPSAADLPSGEDVKLTNDNVKAPLAGAADKAAPAEGAADKAAAPADEGAEDQAKPAGDGEGDKAQPAAEEDEKPKKKGKKKKGRHGRKVRMIDRSGGAAARRAAAPADTRPLPTTYQIVDGHYLFRGKGTPDRPRVGDLRVSFRALQPGLKLTLFGKQQGAEIVSYTFNGDEHLFRALPGTREEAIQALATEHKMITWILRLVGWLMMWFGLQMFFGPINAVLDIVPFLGSAGRFIVGLVLLPVSMLLSTVIIVLSIIAHSPILLVLTLLALGGGGYFLYQKRKARKAA